MKTMWANAAVQTADRTIEMSSFEVPPELAPGEALLAVEACGMCGSDLEQYRGRMHSTGLVRYPLIPGHEIVGSLVRVSHEAEQRWGLGTGARVAVNAVVTCDDCPACLAGRKSFCSNRFIYGYTSAEVGPGLWGGYGEYMVLKPKTVLMPIAAHLSNEDAVLFNPLGAGFDWAMRVAATQPGDVVLVFGPGQRGLACVIGAVEAGASRVIVVGRRRSRWKLTLAQGFGATDIVLSDECDIPSTVREITGGAMADRVVDTTPAGSLVPDALRCARPEGTVVLAGVKGQPVAAVDADSIAMNALTVRGVFGVSDWGQLKAIDALERGQYNFDSLHTHKMRIDELDLALRILGGEIDGEDALHITVTPN